MSTDFLTLNSCGPKGRRFAGTWERVREMGQGKIATTQDRQCYRLFYFTNQTQPTIKSQCH